MKEEEEYLDVLLLSAYFYIHHLINKREKMSGLECIEAFTFIAR